MTLSAGKYRGMRRLADRDGRFKMTAVDQRPPIKNVIRERRGLDHVPYEDIAAVKAVLARELAPTSSAMLLDPHVAYPQAIELVSPAQGVIATLEDSVFEDTPGGRKSAEIDHWSVEKIKRSGADAVKVLAWYRPDADAAVNDHQRAFVERIGTDCARFDIPFVFELLVYPLTGDKTQTTDYVEHKDKHPSLVLDSVREFADPRYGVDLFKLESPVPAGDVPDPADPNDPAVAETQGWFDALGAAAGRPWVMLSAGAGMDAFRRVLTYAYRAGANGYLAGRAIWWPAFQHFPDLDAMTAALRQTGVPYMRDLNRLTDDEATPWTDHPCFGGGVALAGKGDRFRETYRDFAGKT